MKFHFNPHKSAPGAEPGIEHEELIRLPGGEGPARITCIDYAPADVQTQQVEDLKGFLERHRPEWSAVRWIRVEGLSDMQAFHALATKYNLHPLAVEDVLHLAQRPKIESYGGDDSPYQARLFIVARALQIHDHALRQEQVSIFLGHKTVLTFQESRSDLWAPIHQRIEARGSRLRNSDASFLAYSLLDLIVDQCFPILEQYGDRAEELEALILDRSSRAAINEIHKLKRELRQLRWSIWPMREVLATLQREHHECISDATRVYLGDLYDHVIQIIEIVETYREMASDLTETYMSSISNRMNEVMKVLTLIGTIFIPLTFLAGVYGMNFRNFPELSLDWAYPAFWLVCLLVALGMLWFFHRRDWL